YPFALLRSRNSALHDPAMDLSLERFMERHSPTSDRRGNCACSRAHLPHIPERNCRTSRQRCGFPGGLWCSMVAAPYPSQGQTSLIRSEDIPGVPEKCDRFVVVVLTSVRNIVQR